MLLCRRWTDDSVARVEMEEGGGAGHWEQAGEGGEEGCVYWPQTCSGSSTGHIN